jgi:Activator of Hsp90 ATPase homolog 1-like protein
MTGADHDQDCNHPDGDAVVSEVEIAVPPERVFQALITREQAMHWGTNDAFQMTSWEMDARPGGKWRFVSKERTNSPQLTMLTLLSPKGWKRGASRRGGSISRISP